MERSIRRDDGFDALDGSAVGAADLAFFAEDLRTAFRETPLPERVAEDHIASMIGAIQLLAEKGESALEPTSNAHGPDRRASGLPKLRRRTMKQRMIVTLAVTAGLMVSLAGLANAGVLPDPIQDAVGNVLGIDENDVDEGDQVDVDEGDPGADAEQGGLVPPGVDEDADENDDAEVDDDANGDEGANEHDEANENDDAEVDDDANGDEDANEHDDAEGEDDDEDDDAEGEDDDEGDESNSDEGNSGEGSDE